MLPHFGQNMVTPFLGSHLFEPWLLHNAKPVLPEQAHRLDGDDLHVAQHRDPYKSFSPDLLRPDVVFVHGAVLDGVGVSEIIVSFRDEDAVLLLDDAVDDRIRPACLVDKDIADIQLCRIRSSEDDEIPLVEAVVKGKLSEFLLRDANILIIGAGVLPVFVKAGRMVHASGDDRDNRVGSAQDKAQDWIEHILDDNEGQQEVEDPALDAVLLPEEMPEFLKLGLAFIRRL